MRIYVSTFAKYNDGNLFGQWLHLEDYTDLEEFYNDCYELHKDEEDPELLFQDWVGIPDGLISESTLHKDILMLTELNEEERSILEAYLDAFGSCGDLLDDLRRARDSYVTQLDYEHEFEDYLLDFFYETQAVPGHLVGYISKDRVVEDLRHDFTLSGLYVFMSY